jgi:trigger factor
LNIEKVIQEDRQAKLTVEYTPGEFEGFKRRASKKISRNAKIPGFRPGKAPYQVIVNHYGEEAVIQEAIDLLIETDYPNILEQAKIEPSGAGNLETLESLDPPKFILMVPLEPEIDLGDYREIRKDFEMEAFNTSEVDDYILGLRRNSATIVPANHPAEVGDLVYFNLSGEFLNPGEDEDAIITDKTPQQVIIPAEDETSDREWPYPGFGRALLGAKDGDVKEVQYTYPDEYEDEEYKGKTAIFSVEVQSVKALELPDFDEDFVQTLGNFESVEDFREKLEVQMREEHEANYEQDYINAVLGEIIENTSLNYPPQMLEHEQEHVLDDIKERLKNQKMDYETYLKLRDMDEQTFIEEEIRPVAQQRLERSLVVDTLIDAEGLKIDKDLLNEQASSVVNEIFRSGRAEELQKEMGNDEFSRMVSMESVSRTMNLMLKNRLKLIGTGEPIPEDDESDETEEAISTEAALTQQAVETEELAPTEIDLESQDESGEPVLEKDLSEEKLEESAVVDEDLVDEPADDEIDSVQKTPDNDLEQGSGTEE